MAGCIDKMPVIGNKSFIGGFLNVGESNAHFGKDVVSWLNKKPGKSRAFLAKTVTGFTNLPLMKRISCWAQLNVGFDAVLGTLGALKETVNHGLKSGIQSFVQSAVMLAAYVGGSFALPAMLGISVTNMSGIIAGIIGGNIIQRHVEKFVGKPKPRKEEPEIPAMLVQSPIQASMPNPFQNRFVSLPGESVATVNPNGSL